jgi:hypothetical protein
MSMSSDANRHRAEYHLLWPCRPCESRDAHDIDALTDASLNPRDRSYSVTQLFDTLDRNGLSFGRWCRQAPYLPMCGAIASTPHANHRLFERIDGCRRCLTSMPIASAGVGLARRRGCHRRRSFVSP